MPTTIYALTDPRTGAIRKAYTGRGGITQRELGEQYSVNQATIQAVLKRKTWAHIK